MSSREVPLLDHDAPFDWHPVEDMEPVEEAAEDRAGAVLKAVLSWTRQARTAEGICARVLVLDSIIHSTGESLNSIADKSGVTRGAASKVADALELEFGLRHPSKQKGARE